MSTQLIRQEALDGYGDRWMGEVSSLSSSPSSALGLLGVASFSSLLGVLIFCSYTPHTRIDGRLNGTKKVVIVTIHAPALHIGQFLQLEVQPVGSTSDFIEAQVTAIGASLVAASSEYRVELDIPPASYRNAGTHFVANVPSERRRVYKWILQCLFN
jgi:hypothetical protein